MIAPDTETLINRLRAYALKEGFAKVGVCAPDAIPNAADRLETYVDKGHHGQMAWMADRMHWRGNPAKLWPEAKSIIMMAEPYTPKHDPLAVLRQPDRGAISVYAQNRDYHDPLKKRLKRVGRWLIEQEAKAKIKVFVDTAPVMEKPLGEAAGLGWQGKHTNLVSGELGNWFFLGAIFTTIDFASDKAGRDQCGSCRACLDICPTNAFPAAYQLDARRCISYLTIEHKGPIDLDMRKLLGNRIYGCDDCLAICPWNKFAVKAHDIGYHAREELKAPKLAELAALNDAQFRTFFSKSPVKRIGRNQFVRNVLYAIGNSGDATLRHVAANLVADGDPTVSEAAAWAMGKL